MENVGKNESNRISSPESVPIQLKANNLFRMGAVFFFFFPAREASN